MRKTLMAVFFLCWLACLPAAHAADTFRFDMGPAGSGLWKGFTEITPDTIYAAGQGYGWAVAGGQGVERRPRTGGRLRPDDLCGDYVTGQSQPFLVDLPAGGYRVYLIMGDLELSYFYPASDRKITANGKVIYEERISAADFYSDKYFFRSQDKEWHAGQPDIWKKWIEPVFKPIISDINIEGAKPRLEIAFSPSCRVNCLIIYPISKAAAMEEEIAQISARRRESFLDKYYEIAYKDETLLPEPEPEEKTRGAIVFSRNYLDPIYPGSLPAPQERVKELKAFAAAGEYEPLNFALYPLRDLKSVNVSIGDLLSDKGQRISAGNIKISAVAYSEDPYFVVSDRNSYSIAPRFVRPFKPADWEKGVPRRLWLTVHVPEDAAAGFYRGRVKASCADGLLTELPVTVRVLPFKLEDMPDDIATGFYYYLPRWTKQYFRNQEQEDLYWKVLENELRFMRRYNFNSAMAGIEDLPITVKDGRVQIDFTIIDRIMEVYRRAGMNGPLYWYHSSIHRICPAARRVAGLPPAESFDPKQFDDPAMRKAFKEIVGQIVEHARQKKWPEFYFYISDEYGAHAREKGVEWAKRLSSLYAEVPGAKYAGGVCNELEAELIPYFTMPLFNPPTLTTTYLANAAAAKRRPGLYNLGFDRLSWGFYLQKIDAATHMVWYYSCGGGDPYNPFGNSPPINLAGASLDEPLPTVQMEIMREGMDDYRYCLTLEKAIAAARRSKSPAVRQEAEAAQRTMDEVMSYIRPDFKWYTEGGSNPLAHGKGLRFPGSDTYDKLRWRIARALIALQDAAGPQ